MGATPIAVGGGSGKPTGSENLVYATPNGSSGVASLRSLVPTDIPGGTDSSTFEIDADQSSRWRLNRSSIYDFDIEHYNGSSWILTKRTSDYGSDFVFHSYLGIGNFSYNGATTDDAQNVLTITANRSTGTPGVGFGTSFTLQAESSTTEYASLARIASTWTDPVHLSRTSAIDFYLMSNGVEVNALSAAATGITVPNITLTGSQTQNYVFAAPSGSSGAPSFRALAAGDIPTLTLSKISDAGTMASQAANNVAITGGTINGTAIGATAASTGVFTTLSSSITDNASLIPELITLQHNRTTPGLSGARIGFYSPDSGGNIRETGRITSDITTSSSGSFTTQLRFFSNYNNSFNEILTLGGLIGNGGFSATISGQLHVYYHSSTVVNIASLNNASIHMGSGSKTSISPKATIRSDFSGSNSTLDIQTYTQSVMATRIFVDANGRVGISNSTPATILHAALSSANTSTVENILTVEKKLSSGTAANGLGSGINLTLQSSTAAGQNAARIVALWNDATHASRKGDLVLSAYDASAEREGLRIRGNGSAAAIGFLGAAPAVQQTGGAQTATGTWTATEQAMLQAAYDALRTFGLLT